MDKNKTLIWILGILLAVVVVQAIQVNALSKKVNEQGGKLSELEASTQELSELNLTVKGVSGGGGSLALEKLKELPQMVGGC